MADNQTVSVDEFMSARKDFAKGDVVMKASKAPASWDPKARSARFVMSAEVEDRDRDIIIQAGLDLTEFMKNPVAPFAHRSTDFPIGVWTDIEKLLTARPKRHEGTLNLVPEGTDGVADRLAFHIAAGSIRACSVGFVPRTVERREVPEGANKIFSPGYRILEAELVECSPVSIPSNPAALAKSAAEGDVLAKEIIEQVLDEWVKHPETGLIMPKAEFEEAHKQMINGRKWFFYNCDTGETSTGPVATGERTSVVGSPPGTDASHDSPPSEARSLLRRALDLLAGSGANQAEVERLAAEANAREADQEAAKIASEQAERQKTLAALDAIHARLLTRRELAERHDALVKRLEKAA
jgi:hypothetical protein